MPYDARGDDNRKSTPTPPGLACSGATVPLHWPLCDETVLRLLVISHIVLVRLRPLS